MKLTDFKNTLRKRPKSFFNSISEEELYHSQKVEEESSHFHSEGKGCILRPHIIYKKTKERMTTSTISCLYCETHHKVCCSCGWEFKYHLGTCSPNLKNTN